MMLLASLFNASLAGADFTYGDLVGLIQAKNITSIEQLLPELPEELRANYTLMRQTRSLQHATASNPRVILFGRDAKLTCAFNGAPGSRGFDSLECFQFCREERAFDFRDIQFPTDENGLKSVKFSERNKNARGDVSCLKCHGQDPRPNWDSYRRWPGAYGEDDDILVDTEELTGFKSFVAVRSVHPRYKWLIQDNSSTAPYGRGIGIMGRPNLRFSDFLGRMNGWRGERLLSNSVSRSERLAFAVFALDCKLSEAQNLAIQKAALPPADVKQIAITAFAKTGLGKNQFGTGIFDDINQPGPDWNHQSGYGFLSEDVAMAILTQESLAGDAALDAALKDIEKYWASSQKGDELKFFTDLNSIIVSIGHFSDGYQSNRARICPRTTEIFTAAYIDGKGH